MKKQLCWILAVLLCGCSTGLKTDENKANIVYAAAEYCADDECSEKVRVKYNDSEIKKLEAYLDALPVMSDAKQSGNIIAKLVMQDDEGMQYTITEDSRTEPDGISYYLNDLSQERSLPVSKEPSLLKQLRALAGELLAKDETLGYELKDDYFVVSYSDQYVTRTAPGGQPYFEENVLRGDPVYFLLFFIDESFTEYTQIKDQRRLLTGLLNQLEFADNYTPDIMPYGDSLLYSAESIGSDLVLNKGNELISGFTLPPLTTSMLGVSGYAHYYYDQGSNQYLKQIAKDTMPASILDTLFVPIQIEGNHVRLAKVKVQNFMFSHANYIQSFQPIIEGVPVQLLFNYESLFDTVVNHLDKLAIYDVELDDQQRLKSVEIIRQSPAHDELPIQASDFILNENGDNSIYTYRSISETARVYNAIMGSLNYQIIQSALVEGESFIEIRLRYGYENQVSEKHILIDKSDGSILDDGLLNERYFKGQLTSQLEKQLEDQNIEACALAYADNLNTARCYVKPIIADTYDPNQHHLVFSSFALDEQGKLYLPIMIREYGAAAQPIKLYPQH